MKDVLAFFAGLFLIGLGFFLLLSNIATSHFGFMKVGNTNSAPVLIIIFFVCLVFSIIKGGYAWLTVFFVLLAMVVSVILGTNFYLKHMSVAELLLMVGTLAIGIGLVIKSLLGVYSNKGDKL